MAGLKVGTKIKRSFRQITGIKLEEWDGYIAELKKELAKTLQAREAVANLQKFIGHNGADPTPAGPTLRERTCEYLKSHPPAGAAAIARAIGAERSQVQHVLQTASADFRKTAEGWKLRS